MAVFMPQNAFLHAAYFTLRSGGKTIITFLFDSVFVWCVSVPIAYCLSRFTGLHVLVVFTMVQIGDILKCIVGFVLVKKRRVGCRILFLNVLNITFCTYWR